MSKYNKILLSMLAIGFASFSYADDAASQKPSAQSSSADTSSSDDTQVLDNGNYVVKLKDGTEVELSPTDLAKIKRKESIVKRELYEQETLDQVKNLLNSNSKNDEFDKSLNDTYPLTPVQIEQMRQRDVEVKKARNAPLKDVKLNISSEDLDVDVNNPITLRVARGYDATLVFFDQSGSPWPVEGDVVHDKSSFNSNVVSKTRHIVSFEISSDFSESTAMITLEGHSVPLIVKLVGSDSIVDTRKSIRVLKYGPNAHVEPFVVNELENVSPDMLKILEGGNIPAEAKRYAISGISGEAYLYKGDMYVRTRASLMSPPWKQSAVSNSGYKVYRMKPTSVLLFSNNGERIEATVETSYEAKIKHKKSIFE
ncbi:DotH/IcmK family type IV secretion protein [Pseudomonas luteola]